MFSALTRTTRLTAARPALALLALDVYPLLHAPTLHWSLDAQLYRAVVQPVYDAIWADRSPGAHDGNGQADVAMDLDSFVEGQSPPPPSAREDSKARLVGGGVGAASESPASSARRGTLMHAPMPSTGRL